MGTPTYQPIAEITLGSSASSVTFSNITQAYRDLVLTSTTKNTGNATTIFYRLNGDATTGNYFRVYALGNGSSTSSATSNDNYFSDSVTSAGSQGVSINHFMDYSATDKHKTVIGRHDVPDGGFTYTYMDAKRWANTAAITSIYLYPTVGSFAAGSTFSLYGVLA